MTLLEIIHRIVTQLKKEPFIHAMWLEGSYATGKHTEKSDIDVWMDVDDTTFGKAIETFKSNLERIIEIDHEEARGVYSKKPQLAKHIFHLKDFPGEQTIELDLQQHSRKFVFSKDKHQLKVLFDKDNTIQWQ